jgi:hypothetical protein
MKKALFLLCVAVCVCAPAFAADPVIADTVYLGNGHPSNGGAIDIMPTCEFVSFDNRSISRANIHVTLSNLGTFSVTLVATSNATQTCANALNAGLYYVATFSLSDGSVYNETWNVYPSSSPLTIGMVWTAPYPWGSSIPLGALSNTGGVGGQAVCFSSGQNAWIVGGCGYDALGAAATAQSNAEAFASVASNLGSGVVPGVVLPGHIFYVTQYGYSIASAVSALAAAGSPGGGGIVWLPFGNTNLPSTLVLGVANSGITIQGQGVPYNCTPYSSCTGGSVVTWTGSANLPMVQENGCYHTMLRDFLLNGAGTAGQGIQFESTGSTTSMNDIENVEARYIQGSPGRAFEIGATSVANVSEIRLHKINEQDSITGLYFAGAQSFAWCDTCYFLRNTVGVDIEGGELFTLIHGEFSGESGESVLIGSNVSTFANFIDVDQEDLTPFLVVTDATNSADYPNVHISGLRGHYNGPMSTPGTAIQWGNSTGAGGLLSIKDSIFSSLYNNTVAINLVQGGGGAGLSYSESGNAFNQNSTTVLNRTGTVYYLSLEPETGVNSTIVAIANLPSGRSDGLAGLTITNAAGTQTGSADYNANFQGNSFASVSGSLGAGFYGGWPYVGSTSAYRFSSTTTYNGTPDTGLSRCGVGCVAAGNGNNGSTSATFKSGNLAYGGTKYSAAGTAIPACAAGTLLNRVAVSDAPSTSAGTAYGSGGGTFTTWVQCTFNSSGSVYAWVVD